MRNAVIVGYKRSPFTFARKGEMANIRPEDILSQTINQLLNEIQINKNDIEDIITGCAYPEGAQGNNIAKIVSFMTDMPEHVAGMTVNRWCGSSMQAIHDATGAIAINSGDVFLCCGVESMTFIPMNGLTYDPHPQLSKDNPNVYMSMGITAENVAKKFDISRKEQQDFAISSHYKANLARESNMFDNEIVSITNNNEKINKDGGIRPNTSHEILDGLKLAFDENGTVTAGTASPLTDGASAVIVCEEEYAKKNNLNILARIKSTAVVGCPPELMGLGPINASKKALKRANLSISDIDIVELNEAFASQSLACIKELKMDINKVNIHGGAIALGHPLGATGAKLMTTMLHELERRNGNYALQAICEGGGTANATIIKRLS